MAMRKENCFRTDWKVIALGGPTSGCHERSGYFGLYLTSHDDLSEIQKFYVLTYGMINWPQHHWVFSSNYH